MTREEFIEILKNNDYSYSIEGDKLVVTGNDLFLDPLKTLPPDVIFSNRGDVLMGSLKFIPQGTEFRNGAGVDLSSVEKIFPDVKFENYNYIYLPLLGGSLRFPKFNIEGIDNKRIWNSMIKRRFFI